MKNLRTTKLLISGPGLVRVVAITVTIENMYENKNYHVKSKLFCYNKTECKKVKLIKTMLQM